MNTKPQDLEASLPAASSIAREVVNELFLRFGVDCNNPNDVKALQADFAYLRKSRAGAEDLSRVLRRSAITVAIGAFAYALWEGIVHVAGLSLTR